MRSIRVDVGTIAYRTSVWLVLGVIVGPLAAIVWVAFFANPIISFPPTGYTLSWFARAWASDTFRQGFLVSLGVGAFAACASLLLGVPASLALARHSFPGREVVSTILLAPLVVPGIVAGAALYVAMLAFEFSTGVQVAGTLGGLLIGHTLLAIPWTVRLVTASLLRVNRSTEEAAVNLGATPWVAFRRVTVPAIRPGMVAAALLSFVISFIDLEKSLFLVGPGMTTLPIAIVNYLEWNLDPTIAAMAAVQIAIIAAALITADRLVIMNGGRVEQTGCPAEVFETPASRFVADFIGVANLLPGRVVEPGTLLLSGGERIRFTQPFPPQEALLALRPERLHILPAATGGFANELPGEIQTATYLGSDSEYHIALPSGTRLVSRQVNGPGLGSPRHRPGDAVYVAWTDTCSRLVAESSP